MLKFVNAIGYGIGGPLLPLLFTSNTYRHLEGHVLAQMAGQQIGLNGRATNWAKWQGTLNWLEWQGKKIVQK